MERKTHTLLEKFVRNSITSQEGKERTLLQRCLTKN